MHLIEAHSNLIIEITKERTAKLILSRIESCLDSAKESDLDSKQTIALLRYEIDRIKDEVRGMND